MIQLCTSFSRQKMGGGGGEGEEGIDTRGGQSVCSDDTHPAENGLRGDSGIEGTVVNPIGSLCDRQLIR